MIEIMDKLRSFMEMCCYLFPYIDSTYDSLSIHSCLLFGFEMDELKQEIKIGLDKILDEMRSLSNFRNISIEGNYRKESFLLSSYSQRYDLYFNLLSDFEKVMMVCSRLIDGFGYKISTSMDNGELNTTIDIITYNK